MSEKETKQAEVETTEAQTAEAPQVSEAQKNPEKFLEDLEKLWREKNVTGGTVR